MEPRQFDLDRIGAGLVISEATAELARAVGTGAAVVTAPPGTGKSTVVPPLVANLVPGRVIVTQPRRVAVRSVARRIAQLDGSRIGASVGFTVRGERDVSSETRIEVVTPGVLLRRLLDDPGLDGVGAVVLDEVHERSLDGDLLLGILTEVRALRDDLALVAMSATLDAAAVAELTGGAIVDIPSALHPLAVDYAPCDAPRLGPRGVERAFLDHLARTAVDAQAAGGRDALVFVPSARDVDEVVSRIRRLVDGRAAAEVAPDPLAAGAENRGASSRPANAAGPQRRPAAAGGAVEVLPLHGRLPARDQDRATSGRTDPAEPRRIVVSTSLAESSLTVPGVRLVVDAGLSREVRRDQARDMSGLVTVSASRASAEQRAGRAARQGPGRVVRAYTEAEFAAFRPDVGPEISSADLTDAALLLADWGTPEAHGLRLLTPPPAASMRQAAATLEALGLVGDDGRVTPRGSRVARMPIGAREGRALLAAADGSVPGIDARTAAEVVAAMSSGVREPGGDLAALVRSLRNGGGGSDRWRAEARRLTALAGARGSADFSSDLSRAAGVVAALARPDWIARRANDGSRAYVFASGTRAAVAEGSSLAGSEWIAATEVQRAAGRAADGTGAVIRLAAALAEQDALSIGEVREGRETSVVEGRVRVREERRLGAIVLSSSPTRPRPEECRRALGAHLRTHGSGELTWSDAATGLRRRLALLHRELADPWPDVSDAALSARLDEWLGADLEQPALAAVDVHAALQRILPWPEATRLGALAPEKLDVPSGSAVRIAYPEDPGAPPVVAVKLQEVFGLADTPRLVDGRVAVQFHLLSPARRPLAVTDDLASFWNGPYLDVRKDMRGRYPKHPWPADPWTAPATSRTNRALR